jgi:diguanylate cyclase (GGDEF)-like protein
MVKTVSSLRRFVETELAALHNAPQVQSVASLARGEVLLTQYHNELDPIEVLFVMRVCASGCQAAGRWLDGLQFCRRGLEMAVKMQQPAEKIPFLAITGNIHLFLHNYHLAARAMREAIAIAEDERLPADHARLLQGLGPIYSGMEQHDTALALFRRADELAVANNLPATRAAALNNMAREYRLLGQLDDAGATIADAVRIATESSSDEWMPYLLHTRGEISAARGALAPAIADMTEALNLLRARTNIPVRLQVLIDLADLVSRSGDVAAARSHLDEASALSREVSLHELRLKAAHARAVLEHGQANSDGALRAVGDLLEARADARKVYLEGQRIATLFVEEVERSEARARRENAAVNELTLRLIETQAQAEKMAKQATRDPLTGLLNQPAFEAAVTRIAAGTMQPVALLMLDIDDFRAIGAARGHLAGDAVLKAVVERVRQSLRTNDLLSRFGGDEFLLLCPAVGPRVAATIASRVLERIAREPVVHEGEAIAVTASLGVACAQSGSLATLKYLVKRADAALRRAKLAGKNRVVTVRVNT